jgi:hypothetical protein
MDRDIVLLNRKNEKKRGGGGLGQLFPLIKIHFENYFTSEQLSNKLTQFPSCGGIEMCLRAFLWTISCDKWREN